MASCQALKSSPLPLSRRQTFASAIASDLPIMTRQRLKTFWRDTVAVLDEARLC
ncbi:hypothetical protein [Megalodesulfovibrio gigas]|uniref:hypothetical protein n=1 Tax=Megalodesulfovibrio gigas TaxID=879 RepID=UPI00041ED160|nr:hypothetical protein [Megalodesulfovibrio gigas]